jgi:predicted secreted protein
MGRKSVPSRCQNLYRAIALLAVLATPFAGSAQAADAARRDILGFSPDGTYFAFEEYGVQDASNFPYSNLYVIDNRIDEWVPGSPFRTHLQQNWAKLDQARSQTRNQASSTLVTLGIGRQGKTILSDPADKVVAAARFLAFTVPDDARSPGLGTVRLRLTEHQLTRQGCNFGNELRGFVLQLEDAQGQPIRILHEDKDLPPSRGCPKGYGLSDVIVYPRDGRGPVLIVIVSVYRFGFGGGERRYIGIAASFEKNPQAGKAIAAPDGATPGAGPGPTPVPGGAAAPAGSKPPAKPKPPQKPKPKKPKPAAPTPTATDPAPAADGQ